MLRLAILSVSLVTICAMSIKELNSAESNVVIEKDSAEIFGNQSFVESELGTDRDTKNHTLTFKFGRRETGADELVYTFKYEHSFTGPTTLVWRRSYPLPGFTTNNVTHVHITLHQNNEVGYAYIISGGIGQQNIELETNSVGVLFLRGTAEIYALK